MEAQVSSYVTTKIRVVKKNLSKTHLEDRRQRSGLFVFMKFGKCRRLSQKQRCGVQKARQNAEGCWASTQSNRCGRSRYAVHGTQDRPRRGRYSSSPGSTSWLPSTCVWNQATVLSSTGTSMAKNSLHRSRFSWLSSTTANTEAGKILSGARFLDSPTYNSWPEKIAASFKSHARRSSTAARHCFLKGMDAADFIATKTSCRLEA